VAFFRVFCPCEGGIRAKFDYFQIAVGQFDARAIIFDIGDLGMSLSTRESGWFRNHAVRMGVYYYECRV